MPSARASSETKNSVLYAMVLFILLFLAATVLAIILYMNNEQYVTDARQAKEDLEVIANSRQISQVKGLAVVKGQTVRYTALDRIGNDLQYITGVVGGEEFGKVPLAGAEVIVKKRVEPLMARAEATLTSIGETPEAVEIVKTAGLASLCESLLDKAETLRDSVAQAELTIAQQDDLHEQNVAKLETAIEEITEELEQASRAAATYTVGYDNLHDKTTKDYEVIIADLNKQITDLRDREREAQAKNTDLTQAMADSEEKIRELNNRLKQYQPNPEMESAALEPDGFVVSVIPSDNLAYINLAQNDHIYRGLTFAVHDSYQVINKSGKGKGTLEVIEIMQDLAKCRITDVDPTNPIMKGDIIANLIWSADKKYLFCVTGDFDFDDDGLVDADGRDRIVSLIEGWGGVTSDRLTVKTDFLVVGEQPYVPERPADEYADSTTPAAVAHRKALDRARQYQEILDNAKGLGVPTFPKARFFYFIGYYQ